MFRVHWLLLLLRIDQAVCSNLGLKNEYSDLNISLVSVNPSRQMLDFILNYATNHIFPPDSSENQYS